ncbi:U6 snRNA-associated Sm-like protein LSm8p [Trypanosoma cruzi]|uniref:Putative U6 snRNA-associated Sm-like protein LSm8 n=1 Tax=Trypanosoma cruzi TaxID=5693 RepID=A0A2V2VQS9_TRYCR|nr:U6 snRNA-associated Sm-like protein LSm8p [Trypanosoma cruzi]PBJ73805.1 U6 snRNA-associated Sm-like protein LSm8p [Trypanosoma cruzi cruzi]PWU98701.1 putative U6 snRNA-associated Sm-like protein LSm8 [Trypanosoma cruzi]RNF20408.1 U6 snRNA-associated Sm-like protein LSm8p [Trypanosoma cruzi]
MLTHYLRRRVSVITTDGRYLVGVLHAADQLLNVVLTSCVERVFDEARENAGGSQEQQENQPMSSNDNSGGGRMQELPMGVMMIRGSDVVCVAAVDTVEEAKLSIKSWRGRNLPAVERVPRAAAPAVS